MAELIGGSGYGDVQNTEPSSPSIGDTWFDTSTENGTGKIYADLGFGADWQTLPVQNEIQNGRTRELLLLLQEKPVPEVQDPLNLQSGLSQLYEQESNDYKLSEGGGTDSEFANYNVDAADDNVGLTINPNVSLESVTVQVPSNYQSDINTVELRDSSGNVIKSKSSGPYTADDKIQFTGLYLNIGNDYYVVNTDDVGKAAETNSFATSNTLFDLAGFSNGSKGSFIYSFHVSNVTEAPAKTGYVTDRLEAPTTAPADFRQWNAIRAQDVTTGGSTSANPVEFEILDSTDTVLNSSRIPKSEIADTAFKLRNREYQETASAGQTQFTIPNTGGGGHYGIPILSVVTVEQNGSILDGAWSFDGDDTITLDSGANDGDTITISYDLDVFDSTLQPRAYLNRASTSENSPSISHFRYEYVI